MTITTHTFHTVARPEGVSSRYALLVVDGDGRPHLPLTQFYHDTQQALSDGTSRTYLHTLLPYFTYLSTDSWRHERDDRWDSEPAEVRESVRDYLIHQLGCKVRRHQTYELVTLTAHSPSTVRVFLFALKHFYTVGCRTGWYSYEHPLLDSVACLMQDLEREEQGLFGQLHRMPQQSGIEPPTRRHASDNYFRLVQETWVPQPIDDPTLHKRLLEACRAAHLSLRDQIVVRLAYEAGARIREILQLTVGDWRARGLNQEATTFSKGSRGRRVKVIRFSPETAKMLRQYTNTDRACLDRESRRLEQLEDPDPLFLSARRKPYDYAAFLSNWNKLCHAAGIDLHIHGLRHWYTTQAMHVIAEAASSPEDLALRKEALVRYMAWRSPETLKAYEHALQLQNYTQMHEALLARLYETVHTNVDTVQQADTAPCQEGTTSPRVASPSVQHEDVTDGWATLLALGGRDTP